MKGKNIVVVRQPGRRGTGGGPLDDQLTREVIQIVADIAELQPDEIGTEARLEDLGIDSLGGLRIVAAVEKKYKIVIDEAAIGKIRTMPDILALVRQLAPDVN